METREFIPDVGGEEKDWPQANFLFNRDTFYSGYYGGVGTGKTTTLVVDAFQYAEEFAGSRQIVTEPSYQMVRDIMVPTIRDVFGSQEGLSFTMNKAPPINVELENGSEIWIRSTETGERLYGPNVARILMDEITLGHQELAFQILAQRARQPNFKHQIKSTGTPKGKNWLWKFMLETRKKDRPAYEVETLDNPHLPEGYVDRLLELYGGWDNPLARQELGGQWLQMVGPVYPMFSRQKHIKQGPDHWTEYKKRFGGIDPGGVAPTALVATGVAYDDRVYAYGEWYKHQASFDQVVEAMLEWRETKGILHWVCDPSAKEWIERLANMGFSIEKATHGNDIPLRVQLVARRFNEAPSGGGPGLFISQDCPNLISEVEMLSWARVKLPGRGEEIMADRFERGAPDHAQDALANVISIIDQPFRSLPQFNLKVNRIAKA